MCIFTGHVLARISILLYDIRKRYREQTAPYAFKLLSLYFDVKQRSVCAVLLQDE